MDGIHFAVLGSPLIEDRTAHAVFTAQVGHRCPGLFENTDDLAVGVTGPHHLESPLDLHYEKIPLLGTAILRGDYRPRRRESCSTFLEDNGRIPNSIVQSGIDVMTPVIRATFAPHISK
jgi:hypothetical protein